MVQPLARETVRSGIKKPVKIDGRMANLRTGSPYLASVEKVLNP
jgi:hypothetical protein